MTTSFDAEQTRRAVGHVTRLLTNAAPGDAPAALAAAIVAALRGHGWRPTQARPVPAWQPTGPPAPPGVAHAHAERIRQAITREDT